ARRKLEPATSAFGAMRIVEFAGVHWFGPAGVSGSRSLASVVRIPASHRCSLTASAVGPTRRTPDPGCAVKATDGAWTSPRYHGSIVAISNARAIRLELFDPRRPPE